MILHDKLRMLTDIMLLQVRVIVLTTGMKQEYHFKAKYGFSLNQWVIKANKV